MGRRGRQQVIAPVPDDRSEVRVLEAAREPCAMRRAVMRLLARLLLAGVIVVLSGSVLHAQTMRYTIYTNGGLVPAFDSGEVACPQAGCVGSFTANDVNGLTITGSVQGQGLPNGRRLRLFGVTATKSTAALPRGPTDLGACSENFNSGAPT